MPAPSPDDFELLRLWRGGNKHSGDELLGRHFGSVFLFFKSKIPDRAEDLAQQTFLSLVEARDQIDERASFKAFVFTIARRRLADHFRRHARKDARTDFADSSIIDLGGGSPSQVVAARQEQGLVLRAMQRIPVDFQIAIELHYWEQMSVADIAEVLGIPPGTVKSRLSRAKDKLRAEMANAGASQEVQEQTLGHLQACTAELRELLRHDAPKATDSDAQ